MPTIGQLAVDASEGVFEDRLYAVWPDVREDRVQVLFSYSADSGKTWSKPLIVNDDRSFADTENGRDHILPAVAVNREGVVAVSWYDRRESPDNLGWRVRIAASFDGGETFTASVPVSSELNAYRADTPWPIMYGGYTDSTNASVNIRIRMDVFFESGGHTTGLVADANGVFHPVWVDNRTGTGQLWTAPVTIRGRAIENGSAELADLENVSKKVEWVVTNGSYDRNTNTVTMTVSLRNFSADTISGPIKIRVVRFESQLGTPELLGSDDGEPGIGAVWDFTSLLSDGVILPDSVSASRELKFRLSDIQPIGSGRDYKSQMVTIDARVFGRSSGKETEGG